jgi:hypothetical protein
MSTGGVLLMMFKGVRGESGENVQIKPLVTFTAPKA